jgi:hypothetical protein
LPFFDGKVNICTSEAEINKDIITSTLNPAVKQDHNPIIINENPKIAISKLAITQHIKVFLIIFRIYYLMPLERN